jgi:predicted flap endonuclease-1-like 5' DNA nuclease
MAQDTTVKTSMYAAIGAPVQLMSTLRTRITAARDAFDDLRDRFPDEAGSAFDQWADEGERLVETWGNELSSRRAAVGKAVRDRTGTLREVGRGFAAIADAPAPVDDIDGIGPVYAEKLARAGVPTAGALIERCRTQTAAEALSEQTGISTGLLLGWAESADLTRIDGIGNHTMAMLNGLGVVTLEHLAHADASDLRSRAVDRYGDSGLVSSIPSEATMAGWIDVASGKLG